MSKSVSAVLPPEVMEGLTGLSPVRDQATILVSVDDDGFPRLSLLSRSEIHVVDETRLVIALWAGSSTSENIRCRGGGVLFRVDRGVSRTIRLRCLEPVPFDTSEGKHLVAIEAAIIDVQADQVGYATIVRTLDFEIREPDRVLSRWREVGQLLAQRAEPR